MRPEASAAGQGAAVLATQRLTLSPLAHSDVDALWPTVSDPAFPRWMLWEAHRSRSETEAFVDHTVRQAKEGAALVWTVRQGDAFCGLVGFSEVVRRQLAWTVDRAELGYWMVPEAQGRGLCTEASRAVLELAFDRLGLHKVTSGCIAENAASRRVLEKLGFRRVGEYLEHMHRHGRWWNYLAFELLERDWRAGRR